MVAQKGVVLSIGHIETRRACASPVPHKKSVGGLKRRLGKKRCITHPESRISGWFEPPKEWQVLVGLLLGQSPEERADVVHKNVYLGRLVDAFPASEMLVLWAI
jgi:hypothetical protein